MAKDSKRKVAFLSSFLPKRCGIATFTSDLVANVAVAGGKNFEPLVVAMHSDERCNYTDPVKFEIRRNVKNDYISAADYINFSYIDMLSVQHEFGLFGGEAGSYLNLLLRRVNAPIITTMHTILDEPAPDYFRATVDVCELSDKVIVMNQCGIDMLRDIYGIDTNKITLIPHGIPDLPFVDSSYYKHKFGMEGRNTILTFGLLSENKGVEMMLRALPAVIQADPSVLYIILGATHPEVLRRDGEAYRFSLQRIVKELGLQDHVIFHNQFVTDDRLHNFLCAADIYVTPYKHREQLTSGTLAFAVGTGKAVVSTPYWAAEELLAGGRGKLVKFDDHECLANTIIEILQDKEYFYSLRRKAYDYGRKITWPVIGKRYWKMFSGKMTPAQLPIARISSTQDALSILEVPEPPLRHLKRLTDDTGLIQHAKFTIPDRHHGYCTDDNARAVIAMTKHYAQYADPDALDLFDRYLSFIHHAQRDDGTVRNFMNYDRQWIEPEPINDALGRTLWAFGAVMANPPIPRYLPIIKDCFDRSVAHVPGMSLRGKAYAIFGMAHYLEQFPGASDIKRYLTAAADCLLEQYQNTAQPNWDWFEDELTYDNAVLPHALYVASTTTGREDYLAAAENTCKFLMDQTHTDKGHFSFVGCKGWYKRGQKHAHFDQQPIEPASTVMMLRAAYDATGNLEMLKLQRKAFDWFLGQNDLHIPVYDFRTNGCSDGLENHGVNLNQGAESMISFLLSLLAVTDSYSLLGHSNGTEKTTQPRQGGKQRIKSVDTSDIGAAQDVNGDIAKKLT